TDVGDNRSNVFDDALKRRDHVSSQLRHVCIRPAKSGEEVVKRALEHPHRTRDSLSSLFRGGASYSHLFLNGVNSFNNLIEANVLNRICGNRHSITKDTRVVNQASHLRCSATITKLEVIKHVVVLLGKT